MSRPLEDQIRALARRNLEATRSSHGERTAEPTTPPSGSRQRRAFAVAAVAMVVALGAVAVVFLSRDSEQTVASADASHILPPADATEISGLVVPEGSTIVFAAADGTPFQLTQLDAAGGGFSSDDLETMMAAQGAQTVEVDGVGPVHLLCPHDPGDGDAGGTTGASWFDGTLYLALVVQGDGDAATCQPADGGESPLVEAVRSLRTVTSSEWQAFVEAHGIPDASTPSEGARSCLTAEPAQICAERDGAVRLTARGLEPGSTFSYQAETAGQPVPVPHDLTVSADGQLPGAVGLTSMLPMPVTITVSGTSADGEAITGQLLLE